MPSWDPATIEAMPRPRRAPQPDAIAAAVRAELERRGMSVNALATATDLWQPELAYWLSGQRSLRSDKAARVLEALGLAVRRARA